MSFSRATRTPLILLCSALLSFSNSIAQSPLKAQPQLHAPANQTRVKLMLRPYNVGISAAAFSPDGRYLLTGGPDELLLLWDLSKGQPIHIFEGEETPIISVAFTAENSVIACSADTTTLQWDIFTGLLLTITHAPCNLQFASILSPDGRFILELGNESHLFDASKPPDPLNNKPLAAILNLGAGDWAVVDQQGRYDTNTPDQSPVLVWATDTRIFELSQLKKVKETHYTPNLLSHILKSDKMPDLTGQDLIPLAPTLQIQTPVLPASRLLHITIQNNGDGIGQLAIQLNHRALLASLINNSTTGNSDFTVDLSKIIFKPGENNIHAFAYDAQNQVPSIEAIVNFNFNPTDSELLQWQQSINKLNQDESARGIWFDENTGLEWTQKDNAADITWFQAINYCRALSLAGHHDWHLPAIDELESIYEPIHDTHATTLDTNPNSEWHVKGNLQLTGWQRSSTRESGSGLALGYVFNSKGERFTTPIDFNNRLGNGPKIRALCVRSSASYAVFN